MDDNTTKKLEYKVASQPIGELFPHDAFEYQYQIYNSTVSQSLQEKITDRGTAPTLRKLRELYEQTDMPAHIRVKFDSDISDLLNDTYKGLHMSLEDIVTLTEIIKPEALHSITNVALLQLLDEYSDIAAMNNMQTVEASLQQMGVKLRKDHPREDRRQPVSQLEMILQNNGYTMRLRSVEFISAIASRHVFFMLYAYREMGATAEELRTVLPEAIKEDDASREALLNLNDSIIDDAIAQEEAAKIKASTAKTKKDTSKGQKAKIKADSTANAATTSRSITLPPATTAETKGEEARLIVKQYQTFTDMMSQPIKTADKGSHDEALVMRTLRLALMERLQAAEELRKEAEKEAKPETAVQLIRMANSLKATQTYTMQALQSLPLIATKYTLTSGNDDFTGVEQLSAFELTKTVTGQDHPNAATIMNVLRAFYFISSQRMQIYEDHERKQKKRIYDEAAGKHKYITERTTKRFNIDFQPIVATFITDTGTECPAETATSVRLQINNIIVYGRRSEWAQELTADGKTQLVKIVEPVAHLTAAQQMQAFTTPQGITLYNILLNKEHWNETDLMNAVFDYSGRTQEREAKARAESEAIEAKIKEAGAAGKSITYEEAEKMQVAEELAKLKRQISVKKSNDRKTLSELFERARTVGVISSFRRRQGKKDFVWEWKRTADKNA